MDRVTIAQTALMAELIGDVTKLIVRAESFATTMARRFRRSFSPLW